ncbi:MAG TPA: cyanophycin synthetase [Chloroflexota bacterium]|nr:cyanophycin synthetase [Chloroflexota bacterium]
MAERDRWLVWDYTAALRWLLALPNWETALPDQAPRQDLARPQALFRVLDLLPPPYPVAIIAGTNGKGSTAVMLESILRQAGRRTGLYTQPHLHTYRERIQVDRAPIAPEAFAAGAARVREAIARLAQEAPALGPVTTYEATTALALWYFAERAVEVGVLEVGLGGRLDATNAVDAQVAVLTPIDLDHTRVLGDTPAAIAAEKAAVIKPGAIAISAPQRPDVAAVIAATAAARGAALRWAGDGAARVEGTAIVTPRAEYRELRLGLLGDHQWLNAATAVAAAEALAERGVPVPSEAVAPGLACARWPGRLEVLAPGPPLVLADGAHNPAGAAVLAAALERHFPGTRRLLVLGVSADKDIEGIVAALAPVVDRLYATEARQPRALARARIYQVARARGVRAQSIPTVDAAIRHAQRQRGPRDLVVVAGSLYVVAEARVALGRAETPDPPLA